MPQLDTGTRHPHGDPLLKIVHAKQRVTLRGIRRTAQGGWVAIEVDIAADDGQVLANRLIDGPFIGVGAKRAAIQCAGTNSVLP